MTHKERIQLIFALTLCATLIIATAAIPILMWNGVNIAKEVTIALIAQWAAVAGLMWRSLEGSK